MMVDSGENAVTDAVAGIVNHWRALGCGGGDRAAMEIMDDEDAPYMAQEAVEVLLASGWQPPSLAPDHGEGAAAMTRQQALYLLREGHLLGYLIGLWLGRFGNIWLALAWGVMVLVLWLRSLHFGSNAV